MGITNYNNLHIIADAFGVEFTHPERIEKINNRINTYAALQSFRRDPAELAEMMLAADETEWPTLLREWTPTQAIGEAVQSIAHLRIGENMKRERADYIDVNRWHYLNQIPLADTINEFVTAINELGEHVHDANAAMLAGKGDAASRAHATEKTLLTLREFNGINGARHAAFAAMLIEPPNLPTLYRRPANDDWSIGTRPEDSAIEQLHRKAGEVRDRSAFGLRDVASGHHNIPANEHSPGVTFVMSAPADEADYLRRINDWNALAVYRNRT